MRSSQCQETTSRKDTCLSASPHHPPLSRSTSTNRQQKHHDATCRCSLAAADQRRARIGFCRERTRRRRRRSRASSAKESGDDAEGSGAHGFLLVSLFLASSFSVSFFFSAFFFPLRRDAGRAPPPRPARAPGPQLGLRARVPADGAAVDPSPSPRRSSACRLGGASGGGRRRRPFPGGAPGLAGGDHERVDYRPGAPAGGPRRRERRRRHRGGRGGGGSSGSGGCGEEVACGSSKTDLDSSSPSSFPSPPRHARHHHHGRPRGVRLGPLLLGNAARRRRPRRLPL